jgi:hypothetical protein
MGSSRPISLFAPDNAKPQKPYAFILSAVAHVCVVSLILYGFFFAPRIDLKNEANRYLLRQVDLTSSDPDRPRNSAAAGMYPGQSSLAHGASGQSAAAAAASASLRQIPKLHLADRTVVQPDVPDTPIVMKQTPLPSLMLWAPQKPNVKVLKTPPVQKLANVNARPSIVRPTPQTNFVDTPISPTAFTTKLPMPTPGTSTPITVRGPDLADRLPQTRSDISTESPSGAVMSISETHLNQGTIALPAINQTAPGTEDGALGAGKSGNGQQNGPGAANNQGAKNGSQLTQGAGGNSNGPLGNAHGTIAGTGANAGQGVGTGNAKSKTGTGGGGPGGTGEGTEPSFTRISQPANGQFGVVVVGSTLTDQFPETADIWGGRLIYSVYLKVGLPQSWILQYSLPANVEAKSASGENHLDPPWPFFLVRPNASPVNVNADALMVHGFVTEKGRFEELSVVFPPGYRHAQALLAALEQWQFRPAKHNGQPARVEILLIIPEDEN